MSWIISCTGNELAWKDDKEFGRQMLAGINAAVIQCLQVYMMSFYLSREVLSHDDSE